MTVIQCWAYAANFGDTYVHNSWERLTNGHVAFAGLGVNTELLGSDCGQNSTSAQQRNAGNMRMNSDPIVRTVMTSAVEG